MRYSINILVNKTTADYILGGLAKSLREIPASAPDDIKQGIRLVMIDILEQLHYKDVDIMNPKNQFYSYARLVKMDSYISIKP